MSNEKIKNSCFSCKFFTAHDEVKRESRLINNLPPGPSITGVCRAPAELPNTYRNTLEEDKRIDSVLPKNAQEPCVVYTDLTTKVTETVTTWGEKKIHTAKVPINLAYRPHPLLES